MAGTQPQFPSGPEGELARLFIMESIENERRAEIIRLTQRLEELAALLQQQQATAIATAAAEAAAKTATALVAQLTPIVGPTAVTVPMHLWDIPEWNSYPGFRKWILDVYREGQSKHVLAELHGTSGKSITRAMTYYHLAPRLWPPKLWPEREPSAPKRRSRGASVGNLRHLGGLAAALLISLASLDTLDSRTDGIVHFCLQHVGRVISHL